MKKQGFYLSKYDIKDFIRASAHRTNSPEAYKIFESKQGELLLKYLRFHDIQLEDYIVLDLANGYGGETEVLNGICKQIVGLDLNVPPIITDSELIIADALNTPFSPTTYDFVVCASLIEHIQEPELLMSELARITKPNGFVYLSFPPFFAPTGGHGYAPFHYFGEKLSVKLSRLFNKVLKRKLFDQSIKLGDNFQSAYTNWGLFVLTINHARRLIFQSGFKMLDQSTKWSPINFSRIPLFGELLTWHVHFLLQKK